MEKQPYQMTPKEFEAAHPIRGEEPRESLRLFTDYQRRLQREGDKRPMGVILLAILDSGRGTGTADISGPNRAYRKAILSQARYEGLPGVSTDE